MKQFPIRRLILLLAVPVVLVCASCGTKDDGRVPVYPVTGQVLVNGKPANHAQVFFHPQDPSCKLFPHGRVDSDGSFQLSTYELNDGAPAGDYLVAIVWQDPPPPGSAPDAPEGPDRLKARYADSRKSKLQVQVAEEPNELDPFEIQIK